MQEGDDGWLDFRSIKENADVHFVLSEFALLQHLEEKGAELVGCCPFGQHGKKDSFSFNVEKKTFQCFSCKKKGSVLDFVQQFVAFRDKRPCGLREAGQLLVAMMEKAATMVTTETTAPLVSHEPLDSVVVEDVTKLLIFESLGVVAREIARTGDASDWIAVRVSSLRLVLDGLNGVVGAMEAKAKESHAPKSTRRKKTA